MRTTRFWRLWSGIMARSRHTNLRIPGPMWERIKQAAAREEVSAAEWIRQAIVARLAWDLAAAEAAKGTDLKSVRDQLQEGGQRLVGSELVVAALPAIIDKLT